MASTDDLLRVGLWALASLMSGTLPAILILDLCVSGFSCIVNKHASVCVCVCVFVKLPMMNPNPILPSVDLEGLGVLRKQITLKSKSL